MKQFKYSVAVIVLIFTVGIQCGVIDNIFGTVKNTTNALRQDVRNVWTFSKSVVGIETPVDNRTEEEKRGLIGGMVHSTRVKVHNIRNYFWNTDTDAKDSGLFGNMYNRVMRNLSKVKGTILGENQTPRPLSEKEITVQKALDKLFFGNGTRQVNGRAFQEAIDNLKKKLQEIRSKVKDSPHYGEGLIDVRAGIINAEDGNDNTPGVNSDVYDAVEEKVNKAKDDIEKSLNDTKTKAEKAAAVLASRVDSTVETAAAKENELIRNGYNKVSSAVNTVEDIKRLSY